MRSPRARIWTFLAGAGLAAGATAVWLLWLSGGTEETGPRAGAAAGVHEAVPAAPMEPYWCARLHGDDDDGAAGKVPDSVGRRRLRLEGQTLQVQPALDDTLVLGVVADARGAMDFLPAARRSFAEAGVELVVSLGGMGRTRMELSAILGALARDAPWPVLALPADWEPLEVHRSAVEALAEQGVLDGSRVRFVEMDGATLATLPGAPHPGRLMAGSRGCVHTADDTAGVVAALATRPGARVLLSHTPPRQRGPGGSDRGATGIHVGERSLAEALAAEPIHVLIHGLVAPGGAHAERGEQLLERRPVVLAAGTMDPLDAPLASALGHTDSPTGALVVAVGPRRVRWWPVRLAPEP